MRVGLRIIGYENKRLVIRDHRARTIKVNSVVEKRSSRSMASHGGVVACCNCNYFQAGQV